MSSIRFAKTIGVDLMTFDNENELHKIKETYPEARLLIRLRPQFFKLSERFGNAKFGCTLEDAGPLLQTAKNLNLNVIGVCFHVGTESRDPTNFIEPIESARHVFDIAVNYGFNFTMLDIGGGYPGDDSEQFIKICETINKNLDKHFPESSGVEVISEPGRFFTFSAYYLVTNITTKTKYTAEGANKQGFMYHVDDGISSSFSQGVWKADYEYSKPLPIITSNRDQTLTYPSIVWGQTCARRDYITKECLLPEMFVGEWLYYRNMGAYAKVLLSDFNGFPSEKCVYHFITHSKWEKFNQFFKNAKAQNIQ